MVGAAAMPMAAWLPRWVRPCTPWSEYNSLAPRTPPPSKNTNNSLYGFDYPIQNKIIKEKAYQTSIKNWNGHHTKNKNVQKRQQESKRNSCMGKYIIAIPNDAV